MCFFLYRLVSCPNDLRKFACKYIVVYSDKLADRINSSMNERMKSSNCLYHCQICFAPANHSNYGVISCPPCKMFFKRNAQLSQKQLQCDFGGHCEINLNNRHMCAACRLERCFHSGMQIELIRGSRFRTNIKRRTKNSSKQFPTLNLLENHFTSDHYNLFSNVISTFDEQLAFSMIERFLSEQNILPFKLRFKCASVQIFLQSIFNQNQDFFIKNQHFRSLISHDRSILIHQQMKYLLLFNSSFIIEQSHLLNCPAFHKTIERLFGRWIFIPNQRFLFDIPLMKFSLSMLCFSSSSLLIDRLSIRKIENIYIDILWRYLIYTYNEQTALKCLLNLIGCFLHGMNTINQLDENENFLNMVNIVIKQTEQSF